MGPTSSGSSLALTELRYDANGFGFSKRMPRHDGYLITLSMTDVQRYETWIDGRQAFTASLSPGDVCVHDLRRGPAMFFADPFHLLAFLVPEGALREAGGSTLQVRDLAKDAVVHSLGRLLLPYLGAGAGENRSYINHLFLALRSHLAHAYSAQEEGGHRAGLAPWQHCRLHELFDRQPGESISLEKMARVCGLSPSGFLRAFKNAMGMPPQRWLRQRRVAQAQALLRQGGTALADIALCTGFSDQSHFTRVFSQQTGVSPGAWRRAQAMAAESGVARPACVPAYDVTTW
ncbi:hypothetical protein RD110_22040 [Rhodoferax koreense]|uniref:HTH araC/xylS-type domain-containing protein n=1 Tax=Rhodoferax koreensis TaxID=1842727 RepID=A0A1P8K0P4_9BURK|nr:hypothetical protein RD110_22040 [Rhodoferax koreense]